MPRTGPSFSFLSVSILFLCVHVYSCVRRGLLAMASGVPYWSPISLYVGSEDGNQAILHLPLLAGCPYCASWLVMEPGPELWPGAR